MLKSCIDGINFQEEVKVGRTGLEPVTPTLSK